jgi:hypothetical protein
MHARQHRHGLVNIVVDEHLCLACVCTVQTAGILLECPSPCHWHGEEECVEAGVVEALADAPAGGNENSWCIVRRGGKRLRDRPPCLAAQAAGDD